MMKKIGIMTFPKSPSYGASLQMTGLYSFLKKLGYEVEIINYKNNFMSQKKHINSNKNKIKRAVSYLLDYPNQRKFGVFERDLDLYPRNVLNDNSNLTDLNRRYSHIICGSDQVWNPKITGKDLNYFLHFCHETKRVAYAPSFGLLELDDEFSSIVKNELNHFSSLSVREASGQQIIKKIMGEECPMVIDPSMLMEKNFWISKEKKVCHLPPKYIAVFVLNRKNTVLKEFENYLKSKTGLPLVFLGGNLRDCFKKDKHIVAAGPSEWLYTMNHAEYIITDSFHGTAFSILLEKEFFASLASSTSTRVENLLKTFSLEDRLINNNFDDIYNKNSIDYEIVHQILKGQRNFAEQYLKNALDR